MQINLVLLHAAPLSASEHTRGLFGRTACSYLNQRKLDLLLRGVVYNIIHDLRPVIGGDKMNAPPAKEQERILSIHFIFCLWLADFIVKLSRFAEIRT